MTPDELSLRAKRFSVRIINLVRSLPTDVASRELGRQLVRSGMSVSSNYRAARRARSKKEFVAKLGIVVEEADESEHWLDLLVNAEIVGRPRLEPLINESNELLRIFVSMRQTARRNM